MLRRFHELYLMTSRRHRQVERWCRNEQDWCRIHRPEIMQFNRYRKTRPNPAWDMLRFVEPEVKEEIQQYKFAKINLTTHEAMNDLIVDGIL